MRAFAAATIQLMHRTHPQVQRDCADCALQFTDPPNRIEWDGMECNDMRRVSFLVCAALISSLQSETTAAQLLLLAFNEVALL